MIAAVTHQVIPIIGASRINKNVIVVPWKTNVSGSTVKIIATTSVDVRLLSSCRVASSACFSAVGGRVAGSPRLGAPCRLDVARQLGIGLQIGLHEGPSLGARVSRQIDGDQVLDDVS